MHLWLPTACNRLALPCTAAGPVTTVPAHSSTQGSALVISRPPNSMERCGSDQRWRAAVTAGTAGTAPPPPPHTCSVAARSRAMAWHTREPPGDWLRPVLSAVTGVTVLGNVQTPGILVDAQSIIY